VNAKFVGLDFVAQANYHFSRISKDSAQEPGNNIFGARLRGTYAGLSGLGYGYGCLFNPIDPFGWQNLSRSPSGTQAPIFVSSKFGSSMAMLPTA
jgi:hypothetical protein